MVDGGGAPLKLPSVSFKPVKPGIRTDVPIAVHPGNAGIDKHCHDKKQKSKEDNLVPFLLEKSWATFAGGPALVVVVLGFNRCCHGLLLVGLQKTCTHK